MGVEYLRKAAGNSRKYCKSQYSTLAVTGSEEATVSKACDGSGGGGTGARGDMPWRHVALQRSPLNNGRLSPSSRNNRQLALGMKEELAHIIRNNSGGLPSLGLLLNLVRGGTEQGLQFQPSFRHLR